MDLKEVKFREALKILVDGGIIMVRNTEEQEQDIFIKMIGEDGALSSSDGVNYQIGDFGDENDHYYDVSDKCLSVTVKYGGFAKNHIIVPNPNLNNEKIMINIADFIKK